MGIILWHFSVLRSTAWSKGGRFLCTVVAIDTPKKDENSNAFQKPLLNDAYCTCGWKNDVSLIYLCKLLKFVLLLILKGYFIEL